ncbi:MAG: universal stress protein [Silicimonas sp.]|nr:universal stress protein [Silicimonas sp.]
MIKQILVAVDLTHEDDAKMLLREADKQARVHDAGLSVVTVVPDYGSSWVGSFFKDGTLKSALEAANKTLHDLVRETLPEREKVQHIVEVGVAYESVLRAIGEAHADMVIVGAHKPDMAERILGPNSSRIARHAPVTTMIIRS